MEVGAGALTAYDNIHAHTGERVWGDLCRGPHIPTTGYIPAFSITRSAAAYWRGDQRNAQLQRIYGTAWESQEAADARALIEREMVAVWEAREPPLAVDIGVGPNWLEAK